MPITAAVREDLAARAVCFLAERYALGSAHESRLLAVPVLWLAGSSVLRGRFVRGPGHGQPVPHIVLRVPRGVTARRSLYRRVRVGLTTPAGGLEMPIREALVLTLVHEYTHALQYGDYGIHLRGGEVETTRNEVLYLERHLPALHGQLVPVPRQAPTAVTPGHIPAT
jgi:hypothetical protein